MERVSGDDQLVVLDLVSPLFFLLFIREETLGEYPQPFLVLIHGFCHV